MSMSMLETVSGRSGFHTSECVQYFIRWESTSSWFIEKATLAIGVLILHPFSMYAFSQRYKVVLLNTDYRLHATIYARIVSCCYARVQRSRSWKNQLNRMRLHPVDTWKIPATIINANWSCGESEMYEKAISFHYIMKISPWLSSTCWSISLYALCIEDTPQLTLGLKGFCSIPLPLYIYAPIILGATCREQ